MDSWVGSWEKQMKVLAMGSQVIFKSFSADPFGSCWKSLLSPWIADPAAKNKEKDIVN